jgi:GrpB-like predicted nucleotidyltransferase (UPF0157 family)
MKKIEIRGIFSDWTEVNPQQAREYIKIIKRGMTNLSNTDKNKYINSKRLRGITVEELENVQIERRN